MSASTYTYRALDASGAKRRGSVQAQSEHEAFRQLTAGGLTPICLSAGGGRRRSGRRARVSAQEIAHFTYQLAVLLEARIPIADGLLSIAEQETNNSFRKLLEEIAGSIQAGSSITDAVYPHRRVFGDVYIETIHAAERSGNMILVLEELAEMLDHQAASGKRLRGALTYPIVVVIALTIATTFLITFIVPKFAAMFEQRGVDLPLLTRLLQSVGLSVQHFWWLYGVVIVGAVMGLKITWRSSRGRAFIDRELHHIPLIRKALVEIAVSRFARILGLCLKSGLGLLESLEMAGRASGRPMLQRDVKHMMDQVRHGDRLCEALGACDYFPSFCKRMMIAGEESAELTRMCGVVARNYDREVDHLIKNIATIIEPMLIASMTVVVLIVALAVFLPMWDMGQLVG